MKRISFASLLAILLASGCGDLNRQPEPGILYHNSQYHLDFSLQQSWRGYSVIIQEWESQAYKPSLDQDVMVGHGPIILLRNPAWKADDPQQDIPIFVFTREQWSADMQNGIFAGGVMEEISHNARFVFGIHSRFNWDESVKGREEAQEIVDRNEAASSHLLDE
jgi:hypothetical protein